MGDDKALMEEVEVLRGIVSEQAAAIVRLKLDVESVAALLADALSEAKLATASVERIRAEVAKGVVGESATLDAAEYKAARDGGRTTFVVAHDCNHAALQVRKGADMRTVDYNQNLVEDLIGKGVLKLRAA